jgi:phospholipid/cholesterol/gamma-HCH transport system ATP-binding protein
MTEQSRTPVISVRGLVNRFGEQVVHNGLDFDLYPGEIIGVIGGSGSGKTVLLRSIVGLQRPAAGHVLIEGEDILALSPDDVLAVQRLWGVMFQGGALFSSLTVQENVEVAMRESKRLPESLIPELARMKIAMAGLPPEARAKLPAELSGGMIKRAALARALALDPHVLFLDEPTAGLDPVLAAAFDQLIRDLAKSLDIAVMMITHDLDSLFSICDRVAVLVDKKIKVDTITNLQRDPHPWIQSYFGGPRAQMAQARHG